MLYEKYENEAAFRADFIRPLLTRMGYVSIAHLHGPNEFGKDYVFSELTPFGQLRHNAAVIKHEKSISQRATGACQNVLDQVRDAYLVPYKLGDSSDECHVSSVYVFNSGTITDNAKKLLRAKVDSEPYGRTTHFLDGERLFQLDLQSVFEDHETTQRRLSGLAHDLAINGEVLENLEKTEGLDIREVRGFYTGAVEQFLAQPFMTEYLDINTMSEFLQCCRVVDVVVKRSLMNGVYSNDAVEKNDTEVLQRRCRRARELCSKLSAQFIEAQVMLNARAMID